LHCAGRHRSLGSHVSTIRSLTLDRWEERHIASLKLGGNAQLHSWLTRCKVQNSAIEVKYRTKAATLYREKL
ncbi:hypothetical protein JKP88DRAFT_153122, partial [Tribonema minus]